MPDTPPDDMTTHQDTARKAMDEYFATGKITTAHCERCGELIQILALTDSAWQMSCKCGAYDCAMRGL